MIHMLIGIQGSGKTTFSKMLAEKLHCSVVSSDATRNLHPDWSEEQIWPEVYHLISDAVLSEQDIVFDATNITPKVRQRFKENIDRLTNNYHYEMIAYVIDTPLDVCIERVKRRNEMAGERYLPIEVISSYYHSLIKPTLDEGFKEIKVIENFHI